MKTRVKPKDRWPSFSKIRERYGVDLFMAARRPWEWGVEDGRLWLISTADSFDARNYDGSVLALDRVARKHWFRPLDGEQAHL